MTAGALGAAGAGLSAQPVRRTPTTVAALDAYTSFFHRQPVVVRATAEGDLRDVFLTHGEHRIRAINVAPPVAGTPELLEVDGTFWDIGRLEPNDSRVAQHGIERLSQRLFNKPWPASGELRLLIADETRRAVPDDAVTLQSLALEPALYLDRTVTVVGRFRGRNLYGDLPEAPGTSPDDFVLRAGTAAAWIVGKEPKGRGFELDVMARVDTGRWLQVTGVVAGSDRLIEIEASEIAQVERPETLAPPAVTEDLRTPGPAPEVIFSTPTQDDTEVAVDALVRFQFSRDMQGDSFEDHVDVAYFGQTDDELEFEVEYRPLNRVLNVILAEPFTPYSTLEVTLGEGILATDGAALQQFTLRFSTGGS